MTDRIEAPPARRARDLNFRVVAMIVAAALFMDQFDATVLATALPAMARDFGVTAPNMSIALTSYLLSLAVFIPASGWAADRYGARNVFCAAIVIFVAGSMLCGQAPTLTLLVLARLVQGAGAAMMLPIGRLVLLRTVAKSDLVSAMSWLIIPVMIGPVLGPPVGGFIVTYLDWRWIFYVNAPIGALGLVLVALFIDNVRAERPGRFDGIGLLVSGIALGCLLFGFEMASRDGEGRTAAILLAIGVAAAALYVLYARRHPAPILDITLLRIDTFRLSMIGGSITRIGHGAMPFLLPLMIQIGFGRSAAASGLITFAVAFGGMAMKVAGTPILRRFGFRTTLIVNGIVASLLYAACAALRPGWPDWAIYAILLVGGFFMSLQFTAYNTIAYDEIPRERMSAATSFYTTFQQLMLSFGICAAATALNVTIALAGHARPTVGDFSIAFVAVTAISLLAVIPNLLLPADAGAEISGHRPAARAPHASD